ncbi:UDP-glucose dehydrogenase [Penicillium macrosclerotiorum]|uniref:UDP-glucose dehydrogenase n=1 Tax=Penicillium macrosclerotiorum TaxID=303699 RepID=UPI002548BEC5|nr:UDP-glucose dehydrogenase [Penicillium macrosclerotiorum]KAJ5698717.1 UDP-glucose dehydrogenase [Penicillium macrosclerotiorum]
MTVTLVSFPPSPDASDDGSATPDFFKTRPSTHPASTHRLATPPHEGQRVDVDACINQISGPVVTPSKALTSVVAVIGVGYVGYQLVTAFAKVYSVIAYDVDQRRLNHLSETDPNPNICYTSNPNDIADATHFLVSVPTRLHHDNTVDTQHLESAISLVAQYARPGSTVIIESSVAVGMTRQLIHEVMRSKGLKAGMSPERVDPGRVNPAFETIPKIISGLDDIVPGSLASIHELYQEIFEHLVVVSSPEVAEMTKLYENCQRMVCIAHANEMADACHAIGINALEVSSAAATKPFGYQPYSPGLGVGGHCIPVNPYYLLTNSEFPLLQAATEKMAARPARMGDRVMRKYLKQSRSPSRADRARVLVVGVGFKRGQSVLSNSPALSLMRHLLSEWDAYVAFADPLVSAGAVQFCPRLDDQTQWNKQSLEEFDVIIVAVDQVGLDMAVLDGLDGVLVENFVNCC